MSSEQIKVVVALFDLLLVGIRFLVFYEPGERVTKGDHIPRVSDLIDANYSKRNNNANVSVSDKRVLIFIKEMTAHSL